MRIFVSSTYIDLVEYRKVVERAINVLDEQHRMMEYFGSRPEEPKTAALNEVGRCDVFIGIYAHRYGTVPAGDEKSVTEQEFDRAQKLGKPIFVYRVNADQPWPPKMIERGEGEKKLAEFMKHADQLLRSEFTTPDDLGARVAADLGRYLKESASSLMGTTTAAITPVPTTVTYERYAAHLVATLDKIDATRIAAALDRTLERIPLTEVYVPLHGSVAIPERDVYERAARVAGRKLGDVVGDAEEMARLEKERVTSLPLCDALAKYPGLILLGDPGSGKTTFLKYAAVAFAQNAQVPRLGSKDPRLPIFLSIAAYAERLREEKHQLPLTDYFARYYRDVHGLTDDLVSLFKDALDKGNATVLLDGLDEVKDAAERGRVAEQVERFWNQSRKAGNRLVITSRIIGYQRLTTEGLTHLTVHDFDDDDIRLFLEKWCPVIERAAEKDSALAALNAARERRELEDAIFHGTQGVRELATNPLLLTLLALIKRKGVRLPEQRVELYEEYIKALVENWSLHRNPDRIIIQTRRYGETERILAALALWMRETNPEAGTVDQPAVEEWLTERHAGPNVTPDQARAAAEKFVTDLRRDCGLIVERGHRVYGFIHQTLEEYLAAKGLCYLSGTEIEPILAEMREHQMLARDIWRETTLLTVGHLSVIQRAPDRAAQLVERFLREEQSGDARGLNIVRAGEALRDVGRAGVTDTAWDATILALHAAMVDAALPATTRRDAGLLLGDLGWLPKDDDALDSLVLIPKGKFLYGEKNATREIKYDYRLGKYPVTNWQFRQFVDADGYGDPKKPKPAWWSDAGWTWRTGKPRYEWQKTDQPDDFDDRRWNNPLQPVTGVTWYEAEAFCNWLTAQWRAEGRIGAKQVVRLPTDEEWEKAARGLNGSEYAWGDGFDAAKCNTDESHLNATTPVTMYPSGASHWFHPNGSGIFDLTGNVWEWMGNEYRKGSDAFALRGGAWHLHPDPARAAFRTYGNPDYSGTYFGFRVVVAQ